MAETGNLDLMVAILNVVFDVVELQTLNELSSVSK